ncbi:MAG TPA: GNAT family N-acetyltransferase [Synergistaceae bacterium]|jgi:GNAT superfamily N-acetyltransferase|nr:GNAT family N-acetyltransferase [Synergistaceae bacterium]
MMAEEIVIREYEPGDASLVSHLHMRLYGRTYGFRGIFEHYVMAGMAGFLRDPSGGQLWVALRDGVVVGAIAIVKSGEGSAQLRWFIVDETVQGRGLGRRLLDRAMAFCQERGYDKVTLWTAEVLHAARHLYEEYGFVPVERKANDEWTDGVIIEERWERSAPSPKG